MAVLFYGAELGTSDSFVHLGQVSGPLVRHVLSFGFITFGRRLQSHSLSIGLAKYLMCPQ